MLRTKLSLLWVTAFLLLLLTACNNSTAVEPTTAPTIDLQSSEDSIKVAVLAIRSAVAAQSQYGPIIDYLSETIGQPFELVPVGQDSQLTVVKQDQVDFTFNNPLSAVQIRRLYDTDFLATLSRVNTGSEFSGVIIARADSGISTIEDLKEQDVTCVDFTTAAGGCIFQMYHVLQAGIDPDNDFASFTETPSQDNIVLGVLNGTFDVGFIRTGQLERMVREGTLLNLDELTIIDQADDDFFFPHTTRLYPEWPFAALPNTDPALAARVQEALLALTPDHPAMENARAVGFESDISYQPLDDLIIELQLPSWDAE